jgi:sugar lactone lactonase YvrE
MTFWRYLIFLCVASAAFSAPKEIWTLSTGLANPESSHFDAESQAIYVSNLAGEANKKDGIGWISKVGLDGKMLVEKWVEGLNAPKGIRIHKGKMWVSDIDTVVGIDVKTAKITDKIQISAAQFLNDIAINDEGTVYVSDMADPRIYEIQGNSVQVLVAGEDLQSPNGLLFKGGKLYVAGWGTGMKPDLSVKKVGSFYEIDLKTEKISRLSTALGNLDGLEFEKGDSWLLSDWKKGNVFRYDTKTKKISLLVKGLGGAADIGYIADKMLLVPEMKANKLHAYLLN